MIRRPAREISTSLVLVFVFAGCAATGEEEPHGPRLVGPTGAADGEGGGPLFLCRVTPGEGSDSFFRRDVLSCVPGEGAPFSPLIDVTGKDGASLGTIDVSASGSVTFFSDAYPLTMRAHGTLGDPPIGLELVRLLFELAVENADESRSPLGPVLPFDVVTLAVENRTTLGVVQLDALDVTADGAQLESRGTASPTFHIAPPSQLLRAGETRTLRIAVTHGTEKVSGSAGPHSPVGDGTMGPRFSVPSGGYAITDMGLVPDRDVAPIAPGPTLAQCDATDGAIRCNVVARDGVELTEASARLGDAAAVALPLDGSSVDVGSVGSEVATIVLSVRVASGIDGIDWSLTQPLDGELLLAAGAHADLDLPFDLVHAQLTYAGIDWAFLDVDTHAVRFRRAWSDSFEYSGPLAAELRPSRTNAWIAVSPGVTEITAKLTTVTTDGALQMHGDVTVTNASYLVTAEGLGSIAAPPESGTSLVSCFIDAGDSLVCDQNAEAPIARAHVDLTLEAHATSIPIEIDGPGRHSLVSLAGLYPVMIALTVELASGGGPIAATARATSASDLPESAPLVARAPEVSAE